MSAPLVVLFDIDGTLLSSGGAGRRAMDLAFGTVCGRPDACGAVPMAGMTDRAIVRAGLLAAGLSDLPETIDAVMDAYLSNLPEEVARAERYRLFDGVAEALTGLIARPGVAVGLGTGNVRDGARIKLSRADVWERFPFGGFGCDSEDRGELLAIGAARGAALLGRDQAECRVLVIGDTPRDVSAARSIGADCLAVATGPHVLADLQDAGATWAVPDLCDPLALQVLELSR